VNATHLLLSAPAFFFGACAVFGIGYSLLACVLIGRFFARSTSEATSFPPITIVKPLCGYEWALLRNLSSFCRQDYPGAVQFLFGVNDANDPAMKAVNALRELHPDAHITVVADSQLYGSNRKVSNIINMLPQAQHDVLVFADSDVGVGSNYLRDIVGELQQPGVELVTCLYHGQPDPGFWPRLSAMATNYQFLPGVMTGLAFGLARPCFGQTIAMRRETLEEIGGFMPFVNHLAEDHAIGEAARTVGGRVTIPPFTVSHACVETSFTKLVEHELRWSRTIRTIDAAGHLGSALAYPLAFALLAIFLSGFAEWSLRLALVALIVRLALKLWSDHILRQPHRDLLLLPFCDLVSFAIFAASFVSPRITWRGYNFNVSRNGRLSPIKGR
jgi:ceramide glucosyltransferase